jgi:hypothetical protein
MGFDPFCVWLIAPSGCPWFGGAKDDVNYLAMAPRSTLVAKIENCEGRDEPFGIKRLVELHEKLTLRRTGEQTKHLRCA